MVYFVIYFSGFTIIVILFIYITTKFFNIIQIMYIADVFFRVVIFKIKIPLYEKEVSAKVACLKSGGR